MYVKLGKNAENFSDPMSGFTIIGKEVKELSKSQAASPKVRRALTGGHLAHSNKDEFEEFEKAESKANKEIKIDEKNPLDSKTEKSLKARIAELEKENEDLKEEVKEKDEQIEVLEDQIEVLENGEKDEVNFEEKTKDELVKYYEDNYEVSEDDVKDFSKKNKDDMIAYLKSLETEEE